VTDNVEPIIVEKNRQRAFWALMIVLFFVPVSGWFVFLGLQPGRPDMSWAMILFGVIGLVAFIGSAIAIVYTIRSPWRLDLCPKDLTLRTPAYDLVVPWERVVGIAVNEVSRRPGCVLIFDDVAAVVQGATFHGKSARRGAIHNAETMQARMEENFDNLKYHLGIPGRLLEIGADDLAKLVVEARTGELWQEESEE